MDMSSLLSGATDEQAKSMAFAMRHGGQMSDVMKARYKGQLGWQGDEKAKAAVSMAQESERYRRPNKKMRKRNKGLREAAMGMAGGVPAQDGPPTPIPTPAIGAALPIGDDLPDYAGTTTTYRPGSFTGAGSTYSNDGSVTRGTPDLGLRSVSRFGGAPSYSDGTDYMETY